MQMRHLQYIVIILLITLCFTNSSCKKDKVNTPVEIPPVIQKPGINLFYTALKIDSIQQFSIVLTYELSRGGKSTGIVSALDSLSLAANTSQYTHVDATLRGSQYYFKIQYPYNLPPEDKIWFRIYLINENGEKTYSHVLSQKVALYQVKNKYVVNGKGLYNNHPKDFFINYEGTAIGAQDNSLIVNAISNDVNLQNYTGKINDRPIAISKIDAASYPPTHKTILFDVPDDLSVGPAKFTLFYMNNLVYTEDITIVNGGLLTAIKHPVSLISSGIYFEYENKLYTYSNYGSNASDANFYSWAPQTNTWQKLPNPPEAPKVDYNDAKGGRTIKGIVYFPPVMVRPWGIYGQYNPYYYEEIIASYDPANGQWNKKTLLRTTNEAEDRTLDVSDSFVFNDKLYCITREFPFAQLSGTIKTQMRVYDPSINTWEYFMDLPDTPWYWSAVVNNGRVYLLTTGPGKQESATTQYLNEFYQLDINSKALNKKNWITDKAVGVSSPYLVSFNNKIYAYGGQYSSGYASLYSSLFTVYDPDKDKWAPVSGYSYYTGWVSQTQGFLLPINNKLYLGLGLDRYTNGNIYGSKIKSTIYNLSIK